MSILQEILPHMPDSSRIWLYLAEKPLTDTQAEAVREVLKQFATEWQAHGQSLAADAELWQNRLIILAVNESVQPATGCSIDSSYRLIKKLENELGIVLSNRMLAPVWKNQTLDVIPVRDLHAAGLKPEYTVLDLTAIKLGDFRNQGIKPLSQTWIGRFI